MYYNGTIFFLIELMQNFVCELLRNIKYFFIKHIIGLKAKVAISKAITQKV